jgi:hypothetical protein
MQFQIRTERNTVTVYADVARIEVEDIVSPSEDDPDEHYFRTIRFIGYDGEAIEVFCSTFLRFISRPKAKRSSSFSTNCPAPHRAGQE